MNAILILLLILFVLMLIFGGKKGAKSFFALFLNFVVLLIAVVAIAVHIPIYIVMIIFCIVVAAINLFLLNSYNLKTQAAFIATMITMVVLMGSIFLTTRLGHLQGFTTEQQEETSIYSMNIGIDFEAFMVFTTALLVITAVIDLTITISSPMYELYQTNRSLNLKELYRSGIRVGKEILATSANTIYLAFVGSELTLCFWFFKLNYSFEHLMNAKIFVQELMSILLGGIAIGISIPITAYITAYLIKKTLK